MFATLNKFISSLDGGPDEVEEDYGFGFQVLRNTNSAIPLEPWFDYLIQIAGRDITNPDPDTIASEVYSCAGGSVLVTIWSAKGGTTRSLYLPVPADASSIGLTFQWEPLSTANLVWHILDVKPKSPADKAELMSYGDYVVGSPDGLLRDSSALEELIDEYMNRKLRLYVYNHEFDVVRQVTITPSNTWGGQGRLGCGLAFGALHRIPAPVEELPEVPAETLYEIPGANAVSSPVPEEHTVGDSYFSQYSGVVEGTASMSIGSEKQDLDVPAGLGSTSLMSVGQHRHRATRKAKPSDMVDAYLEEESQKSEKLDTGAVKVSSGAVPPPPKNMRLVPDEGDETKQPDELEQPEEPKETEEAEQQTEKEG